MSILTDPIFYFIDDVDNDNFQLNFIEPNKAATQLTANLNVSSFTMDQLDDEVARALNAAGQNTYTVTFDRDTRTYTISADDDFDLLITSGDNASTSVFTLIGFTGADVTGLTTYEGNNAAGAEYEPQFPLQDFVGFEISKEGISTKVNESTSGEVEVVTFGTKRLMKFNIKYITNNTGDRKAFSANKGNIDFVQDAIDFMEFITDKNKLEFMKDKTIRATFDNILLESTPSSSDGSGYELKELYSQNLTGYFETGKLTFRKLT